MKFTGHETDAIDAFVARAASPGDRYMPYLAYGRRILIGVVELATPAALIAGAANSYASALHIAGIDATKDQVRRQRLRDLTI
jgi:hypothetical protein